METRTVDVAIVGGGSAGMVAYNAARKVTDKVVLIEGGVYGTTCARVGCMPSKLLIAAAEAAYSMSHAEQFGVRSLGVEIDGRAVLERVRRERDRFVGFVLDTIDRIPDEHRVQGMARFVDARHLIVDGHLDIVADRVVIATGSSPFVPDVLKPAGDRLLINDSLFELETLPASVAVFGPGAVGLELGQALSRLGVEVRLFGTSGKVGPLRDKTIQAYALKQFNTEFYLDPAAQVESVSRTGNGVEIRYQHRERGEVVETFDYLLAATGRRPNLEGLDLQAAGLALDERGIPLFDPYTLRCGQSSIFIAGDANNALPLFHEAIDEGRIAGANAARFPDVRVSHRRTPLAIVFTEPQIAQVGLSLDQVEARHSGCFAIGEASFESQGRSRIMGVNRGLMRLYGEQGSGRFLGAEIFGPEAEHLGHLLAWAAQNMMTVSEMLTMPFYHPVVEEAIRSALQDLNHKLQMDEKIQEKCLECGPGT